MRVYFTMYEHGLGVEEVNGSQNAQESFSALSAVQSNIFLRIVTSAPSPPQCYIYHARYAQFM
jgi:hypothetical protein